MQSVALVRLVGVIALLPVMHTPMSRVQGQMRPTQGLMRPIQGLMRPTQGLMRRATRPRG
ncbi:hypothetical protein APED_11370 [Acanthopleuribacter pedis]